MEKHPCIKQHKFLWLFPYEKVEHHFMIKYISKFMTCSEDFEVMYSCEICGLTKKTSFVEADILIKKGITTEELEMTTNGAYTSMVSINREIKY